ncbi:MAG: T9SS type A sorting domain-containing protein [bacterium]|nr:T9SS type A sorting domain-containing protein [Candidatus Kapabacteria bacterium]
MTTLLRTAFLLATLLLGSVAAVAQNPTAVPRLTDERMADSWYVEQAKLWQQQTERTPSDAQAWFNYYRAVRYSAFGDSVNRHLQHERENDIADAMERAVPNSYEYHLVRWLIGGNNRSLFHHLETALALKPNFAELAPDLISYYELGGDRDKVKEYAKKWYESKALSPSLYEYTYNVLASLEPDAVIFTGGDLDTYPIWILQYVRGLRPDVTVVNTSLVMVAEYREWLMNEFNIGGDKSLLDWERLATRSVVEIQAEFIQSVATMTANRPVYTALTLDPSQVALIENNLYLVGLANRFSTRRIDNMAMLERSWRTFRLDYLEGTPYGETYGFDRTWLSKMNLNYVAPALLLYEHCSTANRTSDAQMYRSLLTRLGRDAGQEAELAEHLRKIEGGATTSGAVILPLDTLHVDEQSAFARSITLFPNPTSRLVTVNFARPTHAALTLIAIDGSIAKQLATSDHRVTIDLAGLTPGSYLLSITSKDGTATKRLEVKP